MPQQQDRLAATVRKLYTALSAEGRWDGWPLTLCEPARKKAGFDIDAYIASDQFRAPINLRAVFTRSAGEHLFETPLSVDQVLSTNADGRLQLDATVPNTRALVSWLLRLGDGVVVHEPVALREELGEIAARMVVAYA